MIFGNLNLYLLNISFVVEVNILAILDLRKYFVIHELILALGTEFETLDAYLAIITLNRVIGNDGLFILTEANI